MIPVRQSTAFETAIGPVLDADGVAVTNCVVGDMKLKKTTGNFAALNGSATLTHVSAGVYDLVLTTSDTDTVGLCCIAIDDTVNAGASIYLQVMEEAVYDALYAASANAYAGAAGSSITNANLVQVLGSVDPVTGLENAGNHYNTYSHFDSDQNLLSSAITSVTSQTIFVLTSGVATDDFYNDMMIIVTGIDSLSQRHRARVTDYVGSTKTITIDTAAPWTVDTADEVNIIAVPRQVSYLPNVAAGGTNGVFIAGTNAATTVTTSFTTTFTGNLTGSVGSVTGAVGSVTGNVGGNVTGSVGSVVGAVGSVTGAVGSVTGNVGGNVVGSVASVTGNVGGNVVGSVGSISGITFPTNFSTILINGSGHISRVTLADTITTYTGNTVQTGDGYAYLVSNVGANGANLTAADNAVIAAIAALNNLSAAQVNAEIVDALATDTYAEPGQGAPAATTSITAKINYLYKAWRNKKTQTSTTFSLFADDASTVDQKGTNSDDGTTTTIGEIATGP